jgi:adenine-specific DNA-methyltransferase
MNEKQEKLIKLLEDMFQLNQTDLDFGIYRIMNQKADEIKQFLQKDLIASIKNAFSVNNNDGLQKELNDLISTITNAGMNPEDSPKVKEIREKLSSSSNNESTENEIYSYLTNFFSRYYKDGDFVSLRRYKKDTYSIPYEGEEVKLHWANSDQYYIKTSENFRDYTFKTKTHTVHFKLQEAQTSTNNNKSDKRVFIYQKHEEIDGELYIYFTYEDGKNHSFPNDIEIQKYSLDELIPTKANPKRTLLDKHLTDYTAKNSFDYFIHKDLKGFLSRELDFFIKNEILYIDDILDISSSQIENTLNKVKTFKTIANKIIAFLSQIEDFQKKLWLKKKFVIDTNYCITLDRISEKYYEEILNNGEQLKEWKILFNVEIKSIEDLIKEKFLVLDTKFFDSNFKDKLLSEFDDIDEECDGVLINSENFGALNLLQERYKEQVKTVYIDPPYNKGSDFAYKDNFTHSSWFSMILDRNDLSMNLLLKNAIQWTSLDDNEAENYNSLLKKYSTFQETKLLTAITNLKGIYDADGFVSTHEYVICSTKESLKSIGELEVSEEDLLKNWSEDEYGYFKKGDGIKRTGADAPRSKRPKGWFPIFITNNNEVYVTESDEPKNEDDIAIFPYGSNEEELSWSWSKSKITQEFYNIIVNRDENNKITLYKKQRANIGDIPTRKVKSFLYKPEYSSTHGSNTAKNIFSTSVTSYTPKSVNLIKDLILLSSSSSDTILDYFAGSGTTGHSVINLNRENNENRKYILVEMGNYFDTVTKPRIQKVIYTNNWKDGKPQDKVGISQMFKYFRLESYEDCLNNLAFKNTNRGLFDDNVKEDYLLNYMLDYETNESLLNIDAFKTPFDYKLKIATSSAGETVETNVDLVETFNYLIGLKVKTRVMNKGFLVIQGENLKEEKILVIWRDGKSNDELNAFFSKMDFTVYDREFDTIYVNGDNNLANLKKDEEHFKVKLIEEEFKARMFGE